jgi:excisionase family DNA binding protein
MDYITVNEAAEKWGVSRRAITYHLVDGRIPGAVKKGNMWLIPSDARRPEDRRKKQAGKSSA